MAVDGGGRGREEGRRGGEVWRGRLVAGIDAAYGVVDDDESAVDGWMIGDE